MEDEQRFLKKEKNNDMRFLENENLKARVHFSYFINRSKRSRNYAERWAIEQSKLHQQRIYDQRTAQVHQEGRYHFGQN